MNLLIEGVDRRVVCIARQVARVLQQRFVCFREEILLGATLAVVSRGYEQWEVVFYVPQSVKYNLKFAFPFNFFHEVGRHFKHAVFVAHIRRPRPVCVLRVNPVPLLFELGLYQL